MHDTDDRKQFFFQALVGSLLQMVGPIGHIRSNSKTYSGAAPRRLVRDRHRLPHVTIQMPVYKEGLDAVIRPTVTSVKAAISTYEMQGGTANIFVNDDGMELISAAEAQDRQEFFDEHQIGWVARPAHNASLGDGQTPFRRRGKFKKASNMNYALNISNRVQRKLENTQRPQRWSALDETHAYQKALATVVKEDEGRT